MTIKMKITLLSLLSLFGLQATAQEGEYRYDDVTQLWRLTQNAAGLGLDNSRNRGFAEFDFEHRGGDYFRVQEGRQRNQLQFNTERYQRIGQFLVGYGRFTFDMDRTKERAWADVMRPYNSNPFFSGSSVKGKYDTQQFDLSTTLSTIPIPLASEQDDHEVTVGARLDYKVADMSRLRDPRSRAQLLDYKLSPAVTYSFRRNTLGLSGHYERRKEKIPGMTTVQEDPNLAYYVMSGMEAATGTIGGYKGYSREWVDHRFGAELSYERQTEGFKSLSTLSIERGTEDAWGTYKYEPGKYISYRYGFTNHNRISAGNKLHQIDISLDYEQAYADEYRQQLVQERDATNGYTSFSYTTLIEFKKRYQVKVFDAQFSYRLNWVDSQSINQYAGIDVKAFNANNKHLLPTSSLDYGYIDFAFKGGKVLLGKRFWIDALVGYRLSTKANLTLADTSSDYAIQVLATDMTYYDANYWHGRLQLTYQFPLTIEGTSANWYVRGYYEALSTQHSLNRNVFGLSIGIR